MLNKSRKAFTLIELLVVITIIGILATGAVTVYTSQIQKARDTTRISDVKAMQSGAEQVYQDTSEYPDSGNFVSEMISYVPKLPKDPKHAQPCNGGAECAYSYIAGDDVNGIELGSYEFSTAFENSGNVANRAVGDGRDDDDRLEVGLDIESRDTAVAAGQITGTPGTGACTLAGGVAASQVLVVINGNPGNIATSSCN